MAEINNVSDKAAVIVDGHCVPIFKLSSKQAGQKTQ